MARPQEMIVAKNIRQPWHVRLQLTATNSFLEVGTAYDLTEMLHP
jgi:hypothetical protein